MASAGIFNQAGRQEWSDEQIVDRVLSAETALYEILMRRYNQRLSRVARAILRGFRGQNQVLDLVDSNRECMKR